MTEWLRWSVGLVLPLFLGYVVWATSEIWKLRQKIFGMHHTNGLSADVAELKRWRDDFRAQYPNDLRKASHDAVNQVAGRMAELERRLQ